MKRIFLWLLCCGLGWGPALANNLQLTHLTLLDAATLRVDLSWEHSWRLTTAPGNHDAVWLFGKYRLPGGAWQPLELSVLSQAHAADSLLEIQPVSDGQGVFVRRQAPGSGNLPGVSLRLGLAQALPAGTVDLEVYGIEMVYVPEGGFWLGDSSSYHHFRRADTGAPFWVESEAQVPASLLSVGPEATLGGDLPAAYPKGFGGFYAMKYELSQAQYRDFLNSLTFSQQQARTTASPAAAPGTYVLPPNPGFNQRNGLAIAQPGSPGQPAVYACEANPDGQYDAPDDGQTRACSFLSWDDLLAYLDWAGLRPLTEWEFEKACRGPEAPVPGGFAWGTTQAVDANSLLFDGTAAETVGETATAMAGLASHGYLGPSGPLRVGFGGNDSSDRLQLGATYWGLAEMSGNLWELCVGVSAEGLAFPGSHGDGQLSATGAANAPGWPTAAGAIHRGGAHNSGLVPPFRDLAVSDRFYHDLPPSTRRNTTGGRGGRSW